MIIDQHELRVFSGTTELEPLESAGSITMDRGWSPFVQGRLSVRAPETLALTQPGTQLRLELTQRFGDVGLVRDLSDLWTGVGRTLADLTSEQTGFGRTLADLTAELITATSWNSPVRPATGRTLTLVVTERTRTRDVHTLQLASLEVTVQNWLWFASADLSFEADTVPSALNAIVQAHDAETSATLPAIYSFATPTSIAPATHTIAIGAPTLGYLDSFNVSSRARIWSPGDSTIRLEDIADPPGLLEISEGENLIEWEVITARPERLMMRFPGDLAAPTTPVFYADTIIPGSSLPREAFLEADYLYTKFTTGPPFNPIGVISDRRRVDREPIRLTCINDYHALPGVLVQYQLPDEAPVSGYRVQEVVWDLGGRWEMQVTI